MSMYILFLAKLKKRSFLEGAGDAGALAAKSTYLLQETRKISAFVNFEMIPPILCHLLNPPANKYCRVWSSMMITCVDFQQL